MPETNNIPDQLPEEILEALKNKDLSEDTLQLIQGWLIKNKECPEKDAILFHLFEETIRFTHKPSKSAYDSLPDIWRRIGIKDRPAVKRPWRYQLRFRVAAVMMPLMILMGMGSLWVISKVTEKMPEAYTLVVASEGIPKTVLLPCGSKVTLCPGSQLAYNETNFLTRRNMQLTGEAFFDVAPFQGTPFSVTAGGVTVKVLGTEFNMKTSQDLTEVSLFSGVVEVMATGNTQTLEPMQQFVVDHTSGISMIREFDADQVVEWRTQLSLDNIRLEEAFQRIGTHFGVQIVMDEHTPCNKMVRARFRGETLPEILDVLQLADRDFEYQIENNTVYITGK